MSDNDPCQRYLDSSSSDAPLSVFYNGVCYLGRQSIETFKYSDYVFLGFKETDHWMTEAIPIIGIDKDTPVAAIVDDRTIREMQGALYDQGYGGDDSDVSIAVIPFIIAVVAIDAGLIATMWAAGVAN